LFAKFNLKIKLLVAFLGVGIIPFFVMAVIALTKADKALYDQAFAQMQSMRDVKKGQVQRYLQSIKDQVLTFSEDRMIVSAMQEFSETFDLFYCRKRLCIQ
jgi:methyl-accepting chemotaxis protein